MLLLPAVDVEFLPLAPYGGVGGGSSSDMPPREPMVDERPRRPNRFGRVLGEDCADWMDLWESLRKSGPGCDEDRFMLAAVKATCDGEGMGDVLDAFSRS